MFVKITVNSFVRLFLLLVVYKCADFEFKPQSPYIKAQLIYLIILFHVWYRIVVLGYNIQDNVCDVEKDKTWYINIYVYL